MPSLPTPGTVVKQTSVRVPGASGSRAPVTVEWSLKQVFVGKFTYRSNVGNSDNASDSPPTPSRVYKYRWVVASRQLPAGPWVNKSTSSWPKGALPTFFWGFTPGYYGYRTPTATRDQGGGPGGNPGDAIPTGTDTTDAATEVPFTKAPKGPLYTNPPIHSMTPGHKTPWETNVNRNARLGIITLPSDIRQITGANYSRRWAFRFMYNPTFWGYSLGSTTDSMPEQINASLTDLLVPGTGSIQLELYLNREADLVYRSPRYYSPRPSTATLRQLWYRGTEYDLDFLYRVINGDPKKVKGMKYPTANVGALIQQRVAIKLGTGLYTTGIINSIAVEHMMMNKMMVPTLTKVTLDFTTYWTEYGGK